jgi:hypothetical protein
MRAVSVQPFRGSAQWKQEMAGGWRLEAAAREEGEAVGCRL